MFAKRNVSWRRRTSMSISTPMSAMKKQARAGAKARRPILLPPVARGSTDRSQAFCNPMNADVINRATIYIRTPRQSRMRRPGEGLYATTGGSISQCLIPGRGSGNATGRAKYSRRAFNTPRRETERLLKRRIIPESLHRTLPSVRKNADSASRAFRSGRSNRHEIRAPERRCKPEQRAQPSGMSAVAVPPSLTRENRPCSSAKIRD